MAAPPALGGSFAGGRFAIARVIGRGGMSTVYEARDTATGARVALKVLAVERQQAASIARFLQEARVAAMLPRDHVVEVMEVGSADDGSPFLVMEYLAGRDLADELVARGPLPIAEAVDLVLQACEGVAAAHAAGLVHRDLKPANLFVVRPAGAAPVVKVLDFGLCKVPRNQGDPRSSMTATDARFGTPRYMSPEQARSTKSVDARTDQHAIGLVLHELITGRPVFEGRTPGAVLAALCTKEAQPMRASRRDVPPDLDAAVLRALAKKPEKRHASLARLAAKIAPFGGPGARASAEAVARLLRSSVAQLERSHAPRSGAKRGARQRGLDKRARAIVTAIVLGTLAFVVVLAALMVVDWRSPGR